MEAPPALERPDQTKFSSSSYSDTYMREVIGLAELYGAVFTWEPARHRYYKLDRDREWFWYVDGVESGNKHKTFVAENYLLSRGAMTREELAELQERLPGANSPPAPAG